MALSTFPGATVLPGLAYSSKWTPLFFNLDTAKASSGAEIDLGIAQYPLHQFEISFDFLHDWSYRSATESLEYKTLFGFVLQQGGSIGRFLYQNPDDYSVTQQPIGTGDGTTTTWQLMRTYGANGFGLAEPVGVVDLASPFNAYLAGNSTPMAPAGYSVNTTNPCLQTITFTSAPAAGAAIAVDMSYAYYCKFDANNFPFEKFLDRLWNLNKLVIRSCRAGA